MHTPTPSPVPGKPYFALSEDAENQLWRARGILETLAELSRSCSGANATITLPAEAFDSTLSTVIDMLKLSMQYVPISHKA
jgi:hypothetical protein